MKWRCALMGCDYRQRATDAEAQLASILTGLHDLHAFTFVGFMDDQEFFKADEVRALIR